MKRINVGKVVNTHSLKGEVRILLNNNIDGDLIKKNAVCEIADKELIIESIRPHKSFYLVKFKNLNSINDVEWMKSLEMIIHMKEDDLSLNNLVGFKVVDEQNEQLTVIVDLIVNKFQTTLVLENKKLIPLVDKYVKSIDWKNKKVTLKNEEN